MRFEAIESDVCWWLHDASVSLGAEPTGKANVAQPPTHIAQVSN